MVSILIKKYEHYSYRYHECDNCKSVLEFTNYDLVEQINYSELVCPNCNHGNMIDIKFNRK